MEKNGEEGVVGKERPACRSRLRTTKWGMTRNPLEDDTTSILNIAIRGSSKKRELGIAAGLDRTGHAWVALRGCPIAPQCHSSKGPALNIQSPRSPVATEPSDLLIPRS